MKTIILLKYNKNICKQKQVGPSDVAPLHAVHTTLLISQMVPYEHLFEKLVMSGVLTRVSAPGRIYESASNHRSLSRNPG